MAVRRTRELQIAGWREWVGLPELGVGRIKAKLDTGARTSALHAFGIEQFERDGSAWVRFEVHPVQRSTRSVVIAEAPLVDRRRVRSSSGRAEERLVIMTRLSLGSAGWPVEITLTRRDAMGFRMLVGRQALRRRVLVDSGRSWLTQPVTPGPDHLGGPSTRPELEAEAIARGEFTRSVDERGR